MPIGVEINDNSEVQNNAYSVHVDTKPPQIESPRPFLAWAW